MNAIKPVLLSAYAIHPKKGSEDGTAWNICKEMAQHIPIIVITRKNNRPAIDDYFKENPNKNIQFEYYDLPSFLYFWKKGARGALLYYFLWQLFLPLFIWRKKLDFSIAHALNFHCDWLPSFLWILRKDFVWGPIGHHEKIPKQYLQAYPKKEWLLDRLKWAMKIINWYANPFVWLCFIKAKKIYIVNSSLKKIHPLFKHKMEIMPAVAANYKEDLLTQTNATDQFHIMSVGRFSPLKGFDLTIRSFAQFYHSLNAADQEKTHLSLIGKGPYKDFLQALIIELKVEKVVKIIDWMPQESLFQQYQTASVFLFPSHEGAGMVIPEAMSFGLPVICLKNYGPGEMLDHTCGSRISHQSYKHTVEDLSDRLMCYFKSPTLLASKKAHITKFLRNHHLFWKEKVHSFILDYQNISSSNHLLTKQKTAHAL